MTETEKNALRVKVAELLFLESSTLCRNCSGSGFTGSFVEHAACVECNTTGRVKAYFIDYPDYPNCLNACAEFEKTLDSDQCVTYVRHLDELHETSTLTKIWAATVKGNQNELYYEAFALVSATATQRCQAFVATMEEKQ